MATLLLENPHAPTLGTLMAMHRCYEQAEGKTGLAYIEARLSALNFRYCWTPGLRNKAKTNWGQVNQHLWRIKALYHGGDCYLADFPGSKPHQRIWQYRQPRTICNESDTE